LRVVPFLHKAVKRHWDQVILGLQAAKYEWQGKNSNLNFGLYKYASLQAQLLVYEKQKKRLMIKITLLNNMMIKITIKR